MVVAHAGCGDLRAPIHLVELEIGAHLAQDDVRGKRADARDVEEFHDTWECRPPRRDASPEAWRWRAFHTACVVACTRPCALPSASGSPLPPADSQASSGRCGGVSS